MVTLRGILDNLRAKRAAEQVAESTVGVWRVKNYLKVRPVSLPPDEEIEKSIMENIEGTRNILNKSKTSEKEQESFPFTNCPSKFDKYLNKSQLPSTKSKLNHHKILKKP